MLSAILYFAILAALVGVIILWSIDKMRQSLTDALANQTKLLEDIEGQDASILSYINETVPAVVAAAVGDALAANDVDEDTAAAAINAAVTSVREKNQGIVDAINAKLNPGETPLPPAEEPAGDEEQPADDA